MTPPDASRPPGAMGGDGTSADTPGAEPVSALLERLYGGGVVADQTLNEVLQGLEGRGPLTLLVLLNLPFMTPIILPGLSILFGLVMVYLSAQMLLGRPVRLPVLLGDRRIPGPVLSRVVRAGVKGVRWLERGIHPRPTRWVTSAAARRLNAALILWLALLLALPLPPTIPGSNLIPGGAILLLALSMAEEDGVVIRWAYGATLAATAYLVAMMWLQATLLMGLLQRVGLLSSSG